MALNEDDCEVGEMDQDQVRYSMPCLDSPLLGTEESIIHPLCVDDLMIPLEEETILKGHSI